MRTINFIYKIASAISFGLWMILSGSEKDRCEAIDRKSIRWEAFMDNQASSFLALVRGCKDSPGLRQFRFSHHIPLVLVALVLMIPRSASAQATATLNGVVRDSSGAVIPHATVTLHNTDTGTDRESLTNDTGLYAFVS